MSDPIKKQKDYVKKQSDDDIAVNIIIADAFVRGIRDLGYKDNGKALAELIDNSWEAGASRADIIFGYENAKTKNNPTQIAIWDDGHGMIPDMLKHAVRWGGTDREGSTEGLGRYGFGLPASCVSIGKRFSVYSKIAGKPIYMVCIDLEDIRQTVSYKIPEPQKADIPTFVKEYLGDREWESGTVVVIEEVDRLKYKEATKFSNELLLPHLGVTYHRIRRGFDIYVDGNFVQPTDPLFLTEGYKDYDTNGLIAKSFDPLKIEVKNQKTREVIGKITVRFSYMPPNFHFNDIKVGYKSRTLKANYNSRYAVMDRYNGLIVSRKGRVIDVITQLKKTRFINNDKFIGVELDFDPSLDSEFGITTAKQQISISNRIWPILEKEGLYSTIKNLRNEYRKLNAEWREKSESIRNKLPTSVEIMCATTGLLERIPEKIKKRQKEEGVENLKERVASQSKKTGKTHKEILEEIESQRQGKLFEVEHVSNPNGPFFSFKIEGGTKILTINTEHRFHSDLYMGPESSPRLRTALELLLFSIGDSMEGASSEARRIYNAEISEWSRKLETALDYLSEVQNPVNDVEQAEEDANFESDMAEKTDSTENTVSA